MRVALLKMKVRLDFVGKSHRREPEFAKMECIPRVGESLVSRGHRVWRVTKVVYTPHSTEQGAILELVETER